MFVLNLSLLKHSYHKIVDLCVKLFIVITDFTVFFVIGKTYLKYFVFV